MGSRNPIPTTMMFRLDPLGTTAAEIRHRDGWRAGRQPAEISQHCPQRREGGRERSRGLVSPSLASPVPRQAHPGPPHSQHGMRTARERVRGANLELGAGDERNRTSVAVSRSSHPPSHRRSFGEETNRREKEAHSLLTSARKFTFTHHFKRTGVGREPFRTKIKLQDPKMKQPRRWTTGLRSAVEEVKKWLRKSRRRSGSEDITKFPDASRGMRWRGVLCVLGGFLIQLALGSYYR